MPAFERAHHAGRGGAGPAHHPAGAGAHDAHARALHPAGGGASPCVACGGGGVADIAGDRAAHAGRAARQGDLTGGGVFDQAGRRTGEHDRFGDEFGRVGAVKQSGGADRRRVYPCG